MSSFDSIKSEIEDIITKGLREDIFKSESAIFVFKTIAKFAITIDSSPDHIKSFFIYVQNLALSEGILALSRIYDNPDKKHPTRCILNLIKKLKDNSLKTLPIVESYQTIQQLRLCNFPEFLVKVIEDGKHEKFADYFAYHLESKYFHNDFQDKLKELMDVRNKIISHNERIPYNLKITWNNVYDLLAFAKNIVGIIGWAYFNTVYMFEGKYELTNDAKRMENIIIAIMMDLKLIEKIP